MKSVEMTPYIDIHVVVVVTVQKQWDEHKHIDISFLFIIVDNGSINCCYCFYDNNW